MPVHFSYISRRPTLRKCQPSHNAGRVAHQRKDYTMRWAPAAKEWTYELCLVQPMVSLIRPSQLITDIIISSSSLLTSCLCRWSLYWYYHQTGRCLDCDPRPVELLVSRHLTSLKENDVSSRRKSVNANAEKLRFHALSNMRAKRS